MVVYKGLPKNEVVCSLLFGFKKSLFAVGITIKDKNHFKLSRGSRKMVANCSFVCSESCNNTSNIMILNIH